MREATLTLGPSRRRLVELVVVGLSIGIGVALASLAVAAFGLRDASATHDGSDIVHACVSRYTGQARIMLPGRPPNCSSGEALVELGDGAAAADVEARLSALEDQVPDCLSDNGTTALFTGCNVQIVSGAGATDAAINGLGNLIVGYNENQLNATRSSSHNLVVGRDHGYSSFGGFVTGRFNQVSAEYASVSAGEFNTASGEHSSISGGIGNVASGEGSSVSGGSNNEASGSTSSVSSGVFNDASGDNSSVSGGSFNVASGAQATVSGGNQNAASGLRSSVSGGFDNEASGAQATVGGGHGNTAGGDFASASGGVNHSAPGASDWVAGSLFEDS